MMAGIRNLGSDRPRRLFAACGAVLLAMCQRAALAECPPRYTVEVIQTQMCPSWPMPFQPAPGVATSIAEDGTVAGYYCQCGCKYHEAFICPPGTTVPITMNRPPSIIGAEAHGVANGNLVCGTMIPSFQGMRGFLWIGFPVINLGTMPGGNWSEALAINSSFQIVGFWGHNVTGPMPQAFIFQSGMMMDLNGVLGHTNSSATDINENGAVTGWMGDAGLVESQAFIYENGRVVELPHIPGGIASMGRAINNNRDVVGVSADVMVRGQQYGIPHATLWRNGQVTLLPELPGTTHSRAIGINDDRWILGECFPNLGPCLWHNGNVWDLNQLIEPGVVVRLAEPADINNAGQIAIGCVVKIDNLPFYNFAARLTPIPSQAGDVDCDRDADIDDLVTVITHWGPCDPNSNCAADLNQDEVVNLLDLITVIMNWSSRYPGTVSLYLTS